MTSLFPTQNDDGNYDKKFILWNKFDVPEGKEDPSHRFGSHRVMNEVAADGDLTELYIRHPQVLDSDLQARTLEVEGIDDSRDLKNVVESGNREKNQEIGESLGNLIADLHRNSISHGDAHLTNFLYKMRK